MSLILSGTDGLSDVDGSAATPAIRGTDANTGIFFPAADTIAFSEGGTEAARFDSSGNFMQGTTSWGYSGNKGIQVRASGSDNSSLFLETASATIKGFMASDPTASRVGLGSLSNHPLVFIANDAERARIDTSGNLLVGTTNTSATAGVGMKFIFSADVNNPVVKTVVQDSSGAYSCYNLYSTNAGAYRFYVTTAGVINATSTTITGISDQRLKENIRDLNYGLSELLLVKPRRFDWKDGKGQDKKDAAGFIAQEFEQVFPNSVSTSLAGEDGIEYKTLCHEELIPTMVKAIQEQQKMIETLQAKVAALEAK